MKTTIKLFSCVIIGLLMLLNSFAVSALEVNSHEVELGDKVTFEIHAAGCSSPVCGIDISITYDSDALEYTENSIEFPYLTGYYVNDKLPNEIRFNALDVNGFSFYEDNIIASVTFTVVSDYAPYLYVKSDVNEFLNIDLQDLGDKYTYVVTTVNKSDTPFDAVSENNDNSKESQLEETSSKTEVVSKNESRSNTSSIKTESGIIEKTVPEPSFASKQVIENTDQINIKSEISSETNDQPETLDIAPPPLVLLEHKSNYYKSFIIGGIVIVVACLTIVVVSKSSLKGEHMK